MSYNAQSRKFDKNILITLSVNLLTLKYFLAKIALFNEVVANAHNSGGV
ncbi:hypothetical protein CCAL9344_02475 [Campylobacter sp. RM9344]|uniref:Uncharacterized protein n=1 Tax=Campylobacter californiensis TaxID=1032243 RepID=A0AAW3ZUB1_9BACT|nr:MULTISPECIES: hypothetical protein [unclassified Campylobacter]MBE2984574.1 hypothetical protein [Campylobacter sp. RM6883]MBE2987041.1 hypothetical protein [Campylobacter sp. RM12919]MBE2988672.1 hypothetical protein [Campylobacter sp. RM12920]MBE2995138.1 hypothetical protein [Campylobacter sp. RM6913]MBE3021677.1 hypothetical protein [Campylobacter sp. 7477a]MBE3029059.1 hypothetical protein [Campylobacter sp. RM9344]